MARFLAHIITWNQSGPDFATPRFIHNFSRPWSRHNLSGSAHPYVPAANNLYLKAVFKQKIQSQLKIWPPLNIIMWTQIYILPQF